MLLACSSHNIETVERWWIRENIFFIFKFIGEVLPIMLSISSFIFVPAQANEYFVGWLVDLSHHFQPRIHLILWLANDFDCWITFSVHVFYSSFSFIFHDTLLNFLCFFEFLNHFEFVQSIFSIHMIASSFTSTLNVETSTAHFTSLFSTMNHGHNIMFHIFLRFQLISLVSLCLEIASFLVSSKFFSQFNAIFIAF